MHVNTDLTKPIPSPTRLGRIALAGACVFAVGTGVTLAGGGGGGGMDEDEPETLELEGIVRDFNERSHQGGHPDFEQKPDYGFGQYSGNVGARLGTDGKPVFTGDGFKVRSQWKDSKNRPICHLLYDPDRGDTAGSRGVSSQGAIESEESFRTWFNNRLGVNMSKPLVLRFNRQDNGIYVFDDKENPYYDSLGGFFPIEGQLLGNPGGNPDRNFHFTLELHTEFTYDEDANQIFRFIGDDDVWVYINGELVIDLGGVHSAKEQYIDVSRLELENDKMYSLDFFFAERHRTQSNFRIETNLLLRSVELPSITAAFD